MHPSISIFRLDAAHVPFYGVGRAGYVDHRFSMHLVLAGQWQLGHISIHTFRPCLFRLSGTRNQKVCYSFDKDTVRGICLHHLSRRLRMTAVISLVFFSSEAEGSSSRSLLPKIQSSGSWHGHYGGTAAGQWCLVPRVSYHWLWQRKRRPRAPRLVSYVYLWVTERYIVTCETCVTRNTIPRGHYLCYGVKALFSPIEIHIPRCRTDLVILLSSLSHTEAMSKAEWSAMNKWINGEMINVSLDAFVRYQGWKSDRIKLRNTFAIVTVSSPFYLHWQGVNVKLHGSGEWH